MSEDLASFILRSDRLAMEGRWGDEAIFLNREIVQAYPGAHGAWVRLGEAYAVQGDDNSAMDAFTEALSAAPARSASQRIAMRGIKELRAKELAGRIAEAELLAFQAVQNAREASDRAIVCRLRKDLGRAERWHERAIELADKRLDLDQQRSARAAFASTLRIAGKTEKALAINNDSIRLDSDRSSNRPAYTSRAATLVDLGRLEEASAEVEALLLVDNEDPMILNTAGRMYHERLKRERNLELARRAEDCFRKAAENAAPRPDAVSRLRSLVAVYLEFGEGDRAIELENFLDNVPGGLIEKREDRLTRRDP